MHDKEIDQAKLVEDNYKLVWSVVNKFHYLKEDKDDLFQSGCIGLIMASKKFDPSLGNAFSTFAIPYIFGEIKNYLRSRNPIKLSKKVLSLQRQMKTILEEKSSMSISEMSNRLNVSYEDMIVGYNMSSKAVSLENTLFEDSTTTFSDTKLVENRYDIDNHFIEFKDIFKTFKKIEKKIFYYRFHYGMNQSETAKLLNISQSKVSRIEKRLTENLKQIYKVN
jgi:RNA polymerase sporulation-specific sigma factor